MRHVKILSILLIMSAFMMAVSCDPRVVPEEQKSLAEVINAIDMATLSSDVADSFYDFLGGKTTENDAVYLKGIAINGTSMIALTARSISRSNPLRVPSASILVNKISPAPSAVTSLTHSIKSIPVSFRPPLI